MNIALVTAGGSGTRMGIDIPKQFLAIYDKPIIIYTLEAFEKHPAIDKIIVACKDGWEDILSSYAKQFKITKLEKIVKRWKKWPRVNKKYVGSGKRNGRR